MPKKLRTKISSTFLPTMEEELPLLDEVNELIEKEKTLMTLKLLEQEQEALLWKQKYEDLVGVVVNPDAKSIVDESQMQKLETIANIINNNDNNDEISKERYKDYHIDKTLLLHKLDSNENIFDLSYMPINNDSILKQINLLLSAKRKNATLKQQSEIILLNNCNLDDSNLALMNILGHTNIKAIDLSFNNLGIHFQTLMLDILKVRSFIIL